MQDDRPSHTAFRAALSRARHQLLDAPPVFHDPVALRIIGPAAADALARAGARGDNLFLRGIRAGLVARSRIAEDALHQAVKAGASQYVVLGAGLDTFAQRNPYGAGTLQVFEVDHPATQAWKRRLLQEAGLPGEQEALCWVPMNFERDSLATALRNAGFRPDRPAFFSWLGVTMYLPPAATLATLREIAGLAQAGGGIVFDMLDHPSRLPVWRRLLLRALRRRFQRMGEPWLGFFVPEALHAEMAAMGYEDICRHDAEAVNARFFAAHRPGLRMRPFGAIVQARLAPQPPR
jgi:methyltransferase (TIGR00027 family)